MFAKSTLDMSSTNSAPAMSTSCHVSVATCRVVHLPRQHVRTVQSTFFLPIWQIKQNVIYQSSDVHLTLFEVRSVRDDEAYAPVHFEMISKTLSFGLNFDPWSRF
jgi:hypothetical protein